QTRDRRPVNVCAPDGLEIKVVDGQIQVGSFGATVEVERKVVGGKDLAERHWRGVVRVDDDETVIDAEPGGLACTETAERVVAHTGDDGAAQPVPCGGDGDVGGASAEVLAESLDIFQPDPVLKRIDVRADTTDRDEVVGCTIMGH